jgi:Protein of unknown function (DUF763)
LRNWVGWKLNSCRDQQGLPFRHHHQRHRRAETGLTPLSNELGIHVCGGRGRHSRRTPEELAMVGERTGVDGGTLARASRLVAKVDSAAVQDGSEIAALRPT